MTEKRMLTCAKMNDKETYRARMHGTVWLSVSSLSGICFMTLKKAGQARSAWRVWRRNSKFWNWRKIRKKNDEDVQHWRSSSYFC